MNRTAKNIQGETIIGRIYLKPFNLVCSNSDIEIEEGPSEYDVIWYDKDHDIYMVDSWYKRGTPQLIPGIAVKKVVWFE